MWIDFYNRLEERTHGEVDRRGGGARVWPSDKKGLDKNESLLHVKKKTQRKERNKNRKKAKKKDGKKADGKKKKADGTEKNSEKKMDEIKGEKYYQKFNLMYFFIRYSYWFDL